MTSQQTISRRVLWAVSLALAIALFVCGVYLGEVVARFTSPLSKLDRLAALNANDSGPRSPPAYAAVTSQIIILETGFQGLRVQGRTVVPLGGIAHTHTVFCREQGHLLEYRSDRYGFHNPDDIWDQPVQVAAIGDSFVQGACVPSDKNMIAHLRTRGISTLNMGSFGNGPLSNLGTIKEYVAPLRPPIVLWFHVSNDLSVDQNLERMSRPLMNYLLVDRIQGLRALQDELDNEIGKFLRTQEQRQRHAEDSKRVSNFLTLTELSRRIRTLLTGWTHPESRQGDNLDYTQGQLNLTEYSAILADAAATVSRWGGRIVFVYVPDGGMFANSYKKAAAIYKQRVLETAQRLGLLTIDLHQGFAKLTNPLNYYTALHGFYGHFNEQGYRYAGEMIANAIEPLLAKEQTQHTVTNR